MTPELIKWLLFAVPVLVVLLVVGPEALRCWKMHMHYKARKQQMDFEHQLILTVLKHAGKSDDDKTV